MILFAALVAWRGGSGRLLGYLFLGFTSIGCAVSFSDSLTSVHSVLRYGWLSAPHGTGDTGGVESLCPGLPLVMDDALQFLEADYQLTSEQRMVYLTDREEALRLDHENARESVAGMSRVFQTEHHVLDGKSFLATHAEFLLVARPDHRYWMYDEMLERHADMVALGRYRFAGRLSDIYRITQVGPSRIMGSSSCALPGSTGSSRVAVPGF